MTISLVQPSIGSTNWGNDLNNNFSTIQNAINPLLGFASSISGVYNATNDVARYYFTHSSSATSSAILVSRQGSCNESLGFSETSGLVEAQGSSTNLGGLAGYPIALITGKPGSTPIQSQAFGLVSATPHWSANTITLTFRYFKGTDSRPGTGPGNVTDKALFQMTIAMDSSVNLILSRSTSNDDYSLKVSAMTTTAGSDTYAALTFTIYAGWYKAGSMGLSGVVADFIRLESISTL